MSAEEFLLKRRMCLAYEAYLTKCVELLNYLVANNVPKRTQSGQVVQGRPKRGAPTAVECSADGYKMAVAMEAYAESVLTPADKEYLAAQKRLLAANKVTGADALARSTAGLPC